MPLPFFLAHMKIDVRAVESGFAYADPEASAWAEIASSTW